MSKSPSRRAGGLPWYVLAGGVAVGVAALVALQVVQREKAIADSTAATKILDGPPCPQLTQAQYDASRLKATKALVFNDVRFERRFGHVDCSIVGKGRAISQVCQFTGPAVLVVASKTKTAYFEPGVGHPATVAVTDGEPRCVMASSFGTGRG